MQLKFSSFLLCVTVLTLSPAHADDMEKIWRVYGKNSFPDLIHSIRKLSDYAIESDEEESIVQEPDVQEENEEHSSDDTSSEDETGTESGNSDDEGDWFENPGPVLQPVVPDVSDPVRLRDKYDGELKRETDFQKTAQKNARQKLKSEKLKQDAFKQFQALDEKLTQKDKTFVNSVIGKKQKKRSLQRPSLALDVLGNAGENAGKQDLRALIKSNPTVHGALAAVGFSDEPDALEENEEHSSGDTGSEFGNSDDEDQNEDVGEFSDYTGSEFGNSDDENEDVGEFSDYTGSESDSSDDEEREYFSDYTGSESDSSDDEEYSDSASNYEDAVILEPVVPDTALPIPARDKYDGELKREADFQKTAQKNARQKLKSEKLKQDASKQFQALDEKLTQKDKTFANSVIGKKQKKYSLQRPSLALDVLGNAGENAGKQDLRALIKSNPTVHGALATIGFSDEPDALEENEEHSSDYTGSEFGNSDDEDDEEEGKNVSFSIFGYNWPSS